MQYRVRLRWWPWWQGHNWAWVTTIWASCPEVAAAWAIRAAPSWRCERRFYGHWIPELVEER